MACNCRNEDGTPTQYCMGQCTLVRASYIHNPEEQVRAMEDSFTRVQLNQIRDIVRACLSHSITIESTWIDGFIKGFEHGQENGQSI